MTATLLLRSGHLPYSTVRVLEMSAWNTPMGGTIDRMECHEGRSDRTALDCAAGSSKDTDQRDLAEEVRCPVQPVGSEPRARDLAVEAVREHLEEVRFVAGVVSLYRRDQNGFWHPEQDVPLGVEGGGSGCSDL